MDSYIPNFSRYEIEDFVNDKAFVSWVQDPTEEQERFWEQVQQEYPQKIYQMQEARRLVQKLSFRAETMQAEEQQLLWESIAEETGIKPKHSLPHWLRVAGAAAVAVLLISVGLYFYSNRQIRFKTGFGKMATLVLPDSSVITLNANSKVRYARNWNANETREVWLDGEAFFEVNHLHQKGAVKPGERFIVHTGQMDVEVLGTSFNVQKRRGTTKVALKTGQVSLEVIGAKEQLLMKPGEVVAYMPVENKLVKQVSDPEQFAAWSEGLLEFDNTPFHEVLYYIVDTYGYQIDLKDKALADKRLSGSFRSRDEAVLFKTLATALGISIRKDSKANKLIIRK